MDEDEEDNFKIINNYYIYLGKRIENQGLIKDYLAINNKENKKYICKKLLKENKKKEIENSIYIHSKIKNDNIVKLYDFSQDDDYYYIFLEYIEGKTLAKIIQNILYEESEIFIIIEQIVNALIYLYESNMVLKDLLLRNIFIKKKNNEKEKTKILLCNLDNKSLLSNLSKYSIEDCYNKIVFKLGIIICELLDKEFYSFLRRNKIDKDEENEEIIKNYIQNKILKNEGITENVKELIIDMIIIKREQRIHITKIKEEKWFEYFYKINNKNKNDKFTNKSKINDNNIEEEKTESIINESCSSNISEIKENKKNKKLNIEEETIITDEEYFELYNKEKELSLGLIDHYDKGNIIKSINLAKEYSDSVKLNTINSNNSKNKSTERTNDKSEKQITGFEKRRKNYEKNKENKSFWNIFICK